MKKDLKRILILTHEIYWIAKKARRMILMPPMKEKCDEIISLFQRLKVSTGSTSADSAINSRISEISKVLDMAYHSEAGNLDFQGTIQDIYVLVNNLQLLI